MKRFFILFIVFNTIILRAQNFSSFNSDLTDSLTIYSIVNSGTDMFIGTNDGVYYSANNNNWAAVNKGIELNDVFSLVISGNVLYAGTYYGVFSSSDKGQNWKSLTSGISDPIIVYDLVVNGSVILAACDYGIYRSADNGTTWLKIPAFANFEVECLAIKTSGPNTFIFAGTDVMGIYMSSNNGSTWKPVNDGVVLIGDEFIASIFARNDGTIFAGDSYGFLYRSGDNGTSWDFIDDNGSVNGYVNGFAYNSTTQELFVGVDDNNLYKSTDDGTTWESCSDNVLTTDMNATGLLVLNEKLYVGTSTHGIFKSNLPINPMQMAIIALTGDLVFGDIEIGKSDSTYLSISNKGNKDLVIDSISCPKGFKCNWSGTIPKGDFVTLSVFFTPLQENTYNGIIVVHSNADTGIDTIGVSGNGYKTGAIISLSGNLDFGDVEIGNFNTENINISNVGKSNLRIDSISCPIGFSGNWVGIIPSNQTQTVLIVFNPAEAKSYSGQITVYSNAVSGTFTINISGVGYKTESIITLSGNLDFGDVEIGTSNSADLSISNEGNADLKIDSISFPSGFSGNWSGTIVPKQIKTVSIKFRPTDEVSYTGNIIVYSNAGGGINTIPISGSGVKPNSVLNPINISKADILLFPNPSPDKISITFEDELLLQGGIHLTIYNSLGIEIKRFDETCLIGKNYFSFLTEDLSAGIYYLYLNTGLNTITKSFVVMK
jgi:hypothetical protein